MRFWQFFSDLSEFKLTAGIMEYETVIVIPIETRTAPASCPHCGCTSRLYKHGNREQVVLDIPIQCKRVELNIRRKRYKCLNCNIVFWERLSSIDKKRQMTKRLVQYITTGLRLWTVKELARYVSVDEKTIRNIKNDYF